MDFRHRLSAFSLLAALSAFWPAEGLAGDPFPSGNLLSPSIRIQFAIYLPGESKSASMTNLSALLKSRFTDWKLVEAMTDDPTGRLLRANVEPDVRTNYAVPSGESLRYFGRGLSPKQIEEVQGSRAALILDFTYPSADRFSAMKSALQLTLAVARESGGFIWDEMTRELFNLEFWEQSRIATWTSEAPNITKQITMHAYKSGDHARVITLGMAKFGLPDLVVQEFAWSNNRTIGILINVVAQLLVEGGTVGKDGSYLMDVREVRDATVREPQVTTLKSNATGKANLRFVDAEAEKGDPPNRLMQIEFVGPVEENSFARQERALGAVFGWSDSVSFLRHNQAMLDASRAAREKFKGYEAAFQKGLRPGEVFKVKSPFRIPGGGSEWMWVEVSSWKGNKIHGLLMNTAYEIPNLRSGAEVDVNVDEIFDYIRSLPDGTSEGNTTAELIERATTETVPVPGSAK